MKPKPQKLVMGLACAAIVSGCNALPMEFASMSEKQRIQVGSDSLMIACQGADVETPMTYRVLFAIKRSQKYLDFIEQSAKLGELSKYLTEAAQLQCFGVDTGFKFAQEARVVVRRKWSNGDAEVAFKHALAQAQLSTEVTCYEFADRYRTDITEEMIRSVCAK
jgi:hypothetical protein